MRRAATCCLVISFVVGMVGCGVGKSKYVGRYVSEDIPYLPQSVLEIKRDGTYRFETTGTFGGVTTGEWEIKKEEKKEMIVFYPLAQGPPLMELKGDTLVDPLFGKKYVKQD